MSDWVVNLTLDDDSAGTPEALHEWTARLQDFDASAARIPQRGQVTLHLYLTTGDPLKATCVAYDAVVERLGKTPVGIETITENEYGTRADEPTMPELMSAAEIADELGVSRQRVHQLRATAGFPAPLADLRGGAVWDAAAVRRFAQTWERKPGRPPTGSASGTLSFRETARGARPRDVSWRIENPAKNRFVLRNIGNDLAENIEIDVSRIDAITRGLPNGASVQPGEGLDIMLIAAWGHPVPNQLYVRWAGQPEWVAVPIGA
jgi:hypothetical protein